jgi:signal transduction histidine kinase
MKELEMPDTINSEKEILVPDQRPVAGIDETHRRMARDLHDDCGGLLCALQFKMEILRQHLPHDPPEAREHADQVIEMLTELGGNLRSMFNRLIPARPDPIVADQASQGDRETIGISGDHG